MSKLLNIRLLFSLVGLGGLILFGLGILVFLDSFTRTTMLTETQRVSHSITTNGFRLALVGNELFLHGEIRSEQQWKIFEKKIHKLLSQNQKVLSHYQVQITNIQNSLNNLHALYISNKSTIEAIRTHGKLNEEAYYVQMTQMKIRIAELQTAMDELDSVVRHDVGGGLGASKDGVLFKLVIFFIIVLLFGFLVWLFFYFRLQIPLTLLARGIEKIRSGDSNFRPKKCAEDELGEVVQSLNAMLDQQQEAKKLQLESEANILKLATDLSIKNRQLDIIGRFQAQFINEHDPFILFDKLLQDILDYTQSEFGLIGDVLKDEQGKDYLKCYAFTNIAWNEETRQLIEKYKETGLIFNKLDNLLGHVITEREAVISNNPANDPRGSGTPYGHPELKSYMGIPIKYGEEMVGMIALANRDKGYDQSLLLQIELLTNACGQIIIARQEREARSKVELLLQEQAKLDGLTKLANRRRFDEYFDQEWRRATRSKSNLALIMMDIDFFKSFNDTYGHLAGDDCLKAFASLLRKCMRRPADLVARYGGEEFVCLIPESSLQGALSVANCFTNGLKAKQIRHKESTVSAFVTMSIGIAVIQPTAEIDSKTLIELADVKLYQAKDEGRNRIIY